MLTEKEIERILGYIKYISSTKKKIQKIKLETKNQGCFRYIIEFEDNKNEENWNKNDHKEAVNLEYQQSEDQKKIDLVLSPTDYENELQKEVDRNLRYIALPNIEESVKLIVDNWDLLLKLENCIIIFYELEKKKDSQNKKILSFNDLFWMFNPNLHNSIFGNDKKSIKNTLTKIMDNKRKEFFETSN